MTYTEILDKIDAVEYDLSYATKNLRKKIADGKNIDSEMRAFAYHATSGFNGFTIQEIKDIRGSFPGPLIFP